MMRKHVELYGMTVALILGVLAFGAAVFIYSGLYNIGADNHHTKLVFKVMQTLRD